MSLAVSPESAISFTLSRNDSSATKSIMSLTAPSSGDDYYCYKVKTTQPRRYLVRPNQGLVAPGSTEDVTIILVDKDKQTLLNEFEQMGPPALESSKDKFLIQSCPVAKSFYDETKALGAKDVAETLTAHWAKVASTKDGHIVNKKLPVKHTVDPDSLSAPSNPKAGFGSVAAGKDAVREGMQKGKEGEGFTEDAVLRKKYDELVSFSVTLTAERDILNNALEQAKRDLNREMAARMSAEDSALKAPSGDRGAGKKDVAGAKQVKQGFSFFQILVIAIVAFFVGKFASGSATLASLTGGTGSDL
ncbi:hypothetical protein TeGR_g11691 [Tetraparma gracilis]|uniref:MSP domain-containing protein n=1 Tax=Tetraparma gracilis TaxID=2962635 RepID=A0ABQ6M5X7_9STRA|nr:hypothetical protein TeGR_g11691 [Tetraparma gracilis]